MGLTNDNLSPLIYTYEILPKRIIKTSTSKAREDAILPMPLTPIA
jgi:hypothetical protein